MSYDDTEFPVLAPEVSEDIDRRPSEVNREVYRWANWRVRSLIALAIASIVVLSLVMKSTSNGGGGDNTPMLGGGGSSGQGLGPIQESPNESSHVRKIRVIVQNLEKRSALASELIDKYSPDVMLAQEINIYSETNLKSFLTSNVSSMGYGTAISSNEQITNIRKVFAPYENAFFIKKKTIIARTKGIQFVSFHGYNGQPFKNVDKLVKHVEAVLSILTAGPTVFAGDFNTWSQGHLDAVKIVMEKHGLQHAYAWPYPGRGFPLDHAFVRDVILNNSTYYECSSDHFGAILDLSLV